MRTTRFTTAAAIALALAGCLVTAGQATAGTTATAGSEFRAQSRSAGLTAAQARTLQSVVDARLAQEGGEQTAANEVTLANGTEILLVLPGETYARDLDAAPRAAGTLAAPTSCGSYTFCAYRGENFSGEVKRQKVCSETINVSTWTGNGSWSNNQSSGTRAKMYGSAGDLRYTTPGAYSEDRSGSWNTIFKIDAC
ncbi:hypothetical protein ACODT5_04110 [Streptomyces sp. 5.8]|uniref:hypothetical protein n=1 Tax=Streptomyces sp. 5.8 TaxID=3406571 RepID=UPI003BB664F7